MSLLKQLFNDQDPELILFDLDGTLIDSVPDLAWCIDRMLESIGRPVAGEDKVRLWVGNGVQVLVQRALASNEADSYDSLFEQAFSVFEKRYLEHNAVSSRVYPQVKETLATMKQQPYQLACVTNKATCFTIPLLKTLNLYDDFLMHTCGDTLTHKKPHPEPLLHTARELGVKPEHCLMVGDSKSDVGAARAAGFKVVCVSYGYNHGEDIRDSQPDAVIDCFSELLS